MGVSTNISLLKKIFHAGFRTKTVDFINERRAAIKKNDSAPMTILVHQPDGRPGASTGLGCRDRRRSG